MKEMEINYFPQDSETISTLRATALVESFILTEDEETVVYQLEDVEIERVDGSIASVDEEDLEYLLSTYDKDRIHLTVLEECRYTDG